MVTQQLTNLSVTSKMVLMGQASKPSSLKHIYGGMRCIGRGYIKQETPLKRGGETLRRERERERKGELKLIVERSILSFNELIILGLA